MSRNNNRNRRKYTRNEKIFYVLSILIIVSMVLGTVAVSLGSSF
jgi:cell division protein FtsL